MTQQWIIGGSRRFALDRPRIMAILNITPDSFFDGGRLSSVEAAVDAAEKAVEDGADLLDIGAQSTRPGAASVPAQIQIDRLVPVLKGIHRAGVAAPISIDTTRASVLEAALAASPDVAVVNDVSAGVEDPSLLAMASARDLGVILMHRRVEPAHDTYSDQYAQDPVSDDIVTEVHAFLTERVRVACAAGIRPDSIVVDPGLGFGKSVIQNMELLRHSARFASLGSGVLSALSRKSFVGRIALGRDSEPSERLSGSIALSVAHWFCGARFFRVHDVLEHVQALSAAAGLPDSPIGIERDTM